MRVQFRGSIILQTCGSRFFLSFSFSLSQWKTKIVLVLKNEPTVDYHKLQAALKELPHKTLVCLILSAFTESHISKMETAVGDLLGLDLVSDWLERGKSLSPLPFLENIDDVISN